MESFWLEPVALLLCARILRNSGGVTLPNSIAVHIDFFTSLVLPKLKLAPDQARHREAM
jgi:hypothetical protein